MPYPVAKSVSGSKPWVSSTKAGAGAGSPLWVWLFGNNSSRMVPLIWRPGNEQIRYLPHNTQDTEQGNRRKITAFDGPLRKGVTGAHDGHCSIAIMSSSWAVLSFRSLIIRCQCGFLEIILCGSCLHSLDSWFCLWILLIQLPAFWWGIQRPPSILF